MPVLSLPRSSVRPLLLTLLLLNGTTVSTLYWAQSVAALTRSEMGPSIWLGLMPSAALAGYAVGVALLASIARDLTTANGLGLHALLLGVGLSTAAIAPTAPVVTVACCLIGMGCSLTQRALACATSAVMPSQRGPVIGFVIASGLTGIVLARAVIPTVSATLGWRTVFMLDAALICLLGLAAALAAQRTDRREGEVAPGALPSAWRLWQTEPVVRRAALEQACVFAAFNGGWAIFPRVLAQNGVAGALPMGIVASIGAVTAVLAGWLCRRKRPARVAGVGLYAVLAAIAGSTAIAATNPLIYPIMIVLDAGTQMALVANQARAQAQATSPAMRGRIAAIVTTIGFAAGAAGAAIGNALY